MNLILLVKIVSNKSLFRINSKLSRVNTLFHLNKNNNWTISLTILIFTNFESIEELVNLKQSELRSSK